MYLYTFTWKLTSLYVYDNKQTLTSALDFSLYLVRFHLSVPANFLRLCNLSYFVLSKSNLAQPLGNSLPHYVMIVSLSLLLISDTFFWALTDGGEVIVQFLLDLPAAFDNNDYEIFVSGFQTDVNRLNCSTLLWVLSHWSVHVVSCH